MLEQNAEQTPPIKSWEQMPSKELIEKFTGDYTHYINNNLCGLGFLYLYSETADLLPDLEILLAGLRVDWEKELPEVRSAVDVSQPSKQIIQELARKITELSNRKSGQPTQEVLSSFQAKWESKAPLIPEEDRKHISRSLTNIETILTNISDLAEGKDFSNKAKIDPNSPNVFDFTKPLTSESQESLLNQA